MALASWRLYPAVAAELREATAIDVEHMTAGTLYPLFRVRELDEARARTTWPLAREFGLEILSPPRKER